MKIKKKYFIINWLLGTYSTFEGTLIAEIKYVHATSTKIWEISFCPADEDIIFLLTEDRVNLMRCMSNQIVVFSTYLVIFYKENLFNIFIFFAGLQRYLSHLGR